MRFYKLVIVTFIAALTCNACLDQRNHQEDIEALLLSNELQRKAHLENNAKLLADQIADTLINVSKGKIQSIANQDFLNRFENYFSQVKYTSWDDTQPPIKHLDDEGTMASVYVQKFLDLQYRNEKGELGEHHYSLFSWNSEYKKINDRWKMTGITSTEKPLTQEEFAKIPVRFSTEIASIPEVDLIPEGVAYDSSTRTTYLSSTYKQKIMAINPDGTYYEFKKEQEDGLWSTVGMEVDQVRNRLWVVSFNGHEVLPMKYPDPTTEWSSKIYCYQLPKGELLEIYEPGIEGKFAFNDLCIDKNGGVYISESLNNEVYYLNPEDQSFRQLLIKDSLFVFPNGITLSDNNKFLYIATRNGIVQYDLATESHTFLEKPSGIVDVRIDGLAYYRGSLIGNQPFLNRIIQFELDEKQQMIKSQRILEANNPYFDQPTTGAIANDEFIYLANAQMRSGFNDGVLKNLNELDTVRILSLRLYTGE